MSHPAPTYAFLFTLTMEKAAKKRDLVHLSRNGKRRKVSRTTYNLWPDHKYGYEEVREEGKNEAELPNALKKNIEKAGAKEKAPAKEKVSAAQAAAISPAIKAADAPPATPPAGDVNQD